jgi:autotransporter-associated beta strand protein
VTNNGSLIFNRSNDFTVANYSSGTGSITKEGAGILTLTNVHRATGGTTVNAGTLTLQDPGADGHGQLNGTLTVNANGIVQLKGNSTALGWNTIRVSTLNINGGLVEVIGNRQHLWNATVNFNGGGILRTNGGTSSTSTTSYWEWGGVTVNVTNPTAEAVIAGRINYRTDGTISTTTFTVADGASIEKGDFLQLTDPMTVSLVDGNDKIAGGIAAEEKIANDGKTKIAVYRRGYFKVEVGTTGCTAGKDAVCEAKNELKDYLQFKILFT